jgi:PQQ-like domain
VAEDMVVDNGRVFTAVAGQQSSGSAIGAVILSAINENTGALIWRDTLDEQTFLSSMIDSGGVIYLMGSGEGGTVWAINESNGTCGCTDDTYNGAPITLAGNTLVIAGTQATACAVSGQTGQPLWSLDEHCPGNAGNGLASYDGTSVWGEDPGGGGPSYVYNPGSKGCSAYQRVAVSLRRGQYAKRCRSARPSARSSLTRWSWRANWRPRHPPFALSGGRVLDRVARPGRVASNVGA